MDSHHTPGLAPRPQRDRRLRRRLATLASAALILLASVAVSVTDAARHGRGGARAAAYVVSPQVKAAIAQARLRSERLQKLRARPGARRGRIRSQTAFEELPARESLELAQTEFEMIGEPVWKPPTLPARAEVERYLGDRAMIADVPGKRDTLVTSLVPLRTKNANGERAPVDLRMTRTRRGFRPRNAVAGSHIARSSPSARLEGGVGLAVDDAAHSRGRLAEDKVFYPETAPDTDSFIAPTPTGVETFAQLRSAQSPEEHVLNFSLPPRASLRSAAGGRTEVVRKGRVIAGVSPALTHDADGLPVPTTVEVRGETLVIEVDHQGGDFRYPLLMDPVIESFRWHCPEVNGQDQAGYGCGFSGADTAGWTWRNSHYDGRLRLGYNGNDGYGLDVYQDPGENFPAWSYAGWTWQAPGDAFIYRAEFGLFRFGGGGNPNTAIAIQGIGSKTDHGHWEDGPKGATSTRVGGFPTVASPAVFGPPEDWSWRTHCARTNCWWSPAAGSGQPPITPGNEYRLLLSGTAGHRNYAFMHLGAAYMYMHDYNPPYWRNSGARPPGHWVEQYNNTVWIEGQDRGLGMRYVHLRTPKTTPGQWNEWRGWVNPCPGGYAHRGDQPPWGRCDQNHNSSFSFDSREGAGTADDWPEGLNYVEIDAEDVVGNRTGWKRGLGGNAEAPDAGPNTWNNGSGAWPVKIDRTAPEIVLGGTLGEGRGGETLWADSYRLDIKAKDGVKGGTDREQRSGAKRITVESRKEVAPDVTAKNTLGPGETLLPGQNLLAKNGLYRLAMQQDGNLVLYTVEGGVLWHANTAGNPGARAVMQHDGNLVLYTAGGGVLWHTHTSGNPGARAVAQDDGNFVVWSTDNRALWHSQTAGKYNDGWKQRHDTGDVPCPEGSCQLDTSWTMRPVDFQPGKHTVRVTAYDQMNHKTSPSKTFSIVVAPPRDQLIATKDFIGLEDWWHFDSTPTGAGSAVHVNLANGNLVWHSAPVVNPGRGLSSVVNLTYNSQQRIQIPLIETPLEQALTPYDEVGRGFSMGASSLTRLNERMNVDLADLGRITLTDPDGTRHLFAGDPAGNVFQPPAGVNLHLRRWSETDLGVPDALGYTPLKDPNRAWAATRPDGVTFFFDQRGYQTSVVDRNHNTLTFKYDYRGPTRSACEAAARERRVFVLPETACPRKLVSMVDAGGRALSFTYEKRLLTATGPSAECKDGSYETLLCASGRLSTITDHIGRVTAFTYSADGDLKQMQTTSPTREGRRKFELGYAAGANALTRTPLVSVKDTRGGETKFSYGAGTANPAAASLLADAPISAVVDRGESPKPDDSEPKTTFVINSPSGQSSVTDTRRNVTRYGIDGAGRLSETTDARGSRTALSWDSDNNPTKLTRNASGGAEAATTTMTYNANGYLTSSSDRNRPESDPASRLRTTTLRYIDSDGIALHQSPRKVGSPAVSIDASRGFVSDLDTVTTPRGGVTDFNYQAGNTGNVIETIDPERHSSKTTYLEGQPGLIDTEFDAENNKTSYRDYDANGLPQTVIDGRDNTWRYRYDEAGNLLTRADPRWLRFASACGARERYRTELTYDALDNVKSEVVPVDSENCKYLQRDFWYDANGNRTIERNDKGEVTESVYSAMDELDLRKAPAAAHWDAVTDAQPTVANAVTDLEYDTEENLTRVTSPRGTRTDAVNDFSTEFKYDSVNQRVASIRHQPGGTPDKLATGFAYDGRGNLIGVADPKRNAAGGEPEQNALNPAKRRFTYGYDLADNRVLAAEDPTGKNLQTTYSYDDNDNLATSTDPRGARTPAADFTTTYTYDARDLLTEVKDGVGHKTKYILRKDGKLQTEISPRGNAPSGSGFFRTGYDYYPTGELREITLPAAPHQYAPVSPRIRYERNVVGDPSQIIDARGYAFSNTFFDTGDIRSTQRPSWWIFDPHGAAEGGDPLMDSPASPGPPEPGARHPRGQVRERSLEEHLRDDGEAPDLPTTQAAGDYGAVEPQKQPDILPAASPGTAGAGTTWFSYDTEMRLERVETSPTRSAPAAGATGSWVATLLWDRAGRIQAVGHALDAARGRWTTDQYGYDRNGNLSRYTDPEGFVTTSEYDHFDREVKRTAPGSPANEITKMIYDANDNLIKRNTPRGSLSWAMGYDALDRMTSVTDPRGVDPDPTTGPVIDPAPYTTTYEYDDAGNRQFETTPQGRRSRFDYDAANRLTQVTAPLNIVTTFVYDENDNQTLVSEPGDADSGRVVTKRSFDGRDLPWVETVGTKAPRTTITEYDPNGNLRRTVNPAGVQENPADSKPDYLPRVEFGGYLTKTSAGNENATVREHSADNLLTSVTLPFGDPDAAGSAPHDNRRIRQEFDRDHLGRVTALRAPFQWDNACEQPPRSDDPGCPSTTTYTYFDNGWIRSMSDPTLSSPDNPKLYAHAVDYDYDPRGNQTLWRSPSGQTERRKVLRTFYPSGLLRTRTATTSDQSIPRRIYSYEYNENRSMTNLNEQFFTGANADQLSRERTTRVTYDEVEQQVLVNERWAQGKDTAYAYDRDGLVTTRRTDGTVATAGEPLTYSGGKTTSFVYDGAGREHIMRVCTDDAPLPTVCNTNDTPDRTTTTNYYANSGFINTRTKPNGVIETYDFRDDGQIERMRRHRGESSLKNQLYEYDVNGNRTRDERGTHLFNAREQLVAWTRGPEQATGDADHVESSRVCYELNPGGAILKQTDTGKAVGAPGDFDCDAAAYPETTYRYNGNRLLSTLSTAPGHTPTTVTFDHDDFGNVTRINPEHEADTTYAYDQFGRMIRSRGPGQNEDRDYRYDALDRRDQRLVGTGTGQRILDYAYVGLSEKLSREESCTQAPNVLKGGALETVCPAPDDRGTTHKFYDYDSSLRRQGQETKGTAVSRYRSYAKDANGSVEGLEHDDGGFGLLRPDRYRYDPYGELQGDEEELGDAAQANPFRFEGFYYDSAIKTYDMQARPYRPDVGRFLTQDRYESASGDLTLQADPITQNRYAFAGGNPVNRVEWDGHCSQSLRVLRKCPRRRSGNRPSDAGKGSGGGGGGGLNPCGAGKCGGKNTAPVVTGLRGEGEDPSPPARPAIPGLFDHQQDFGSEMLPTTPPTAPAPGQTCRPPAICDFTKDVAQEVAVQASEALWERGFKRHGWKAVSRASPLIGVGVELYLARDEKNPVTSAYNNMARFAFALGHATKCGIAAPVCYGPAGKVWDRTFGWGITKAGNGFVDGLSWIDGPGRANCGANPWRCGSPGLAPGAKSKAIAAVRAQHSRGPVMPNGRRSPR